MPFYDFRSNNSEPIFRPVPKRPTSTASGRPAWPKPARTPMQSRFEPVQTGLTAQDSSMLFTPAWRAADQKAGWCLPRQRSGKLPCVVEFIGYNGGRSFPTDWLLWASAGYAHFIMDTRGQAPPGATATHPTWLPKGTGPHAPGFLTMGILDPAKHYYRRVFTDAVRAIEAARKPPGSGFSPYRGDRRQPGRRDHAGGRPGSTQVWKPSCRTCLSCAIIAGPARLPIRTLSGDRSNTATPTATRSRQSFGPCLIFDGVNLAARARGKALFSVGLMDPICPPSTVFAGLQPLWRVKRNPSVPLQPA